VRLKITKTLIESWAYTFNCFDEETAMDDFLKTLNRESFEPSEAMRNGINFENMCYEMACGGQPAGNSQWIEGAKKVANIITSGQFQVPVSCDLHVAGQDFWLYGICDVVKAGIIYDVKFRNKSLGADDVYGKYLDCSQHPLYLKALPEAFQFEYLVSDGTDLYVEKYTRKTSKPIEEHIMNFWAWLHTKPELMKIYQEKWVVG